MSNVVPKLNSIITAKISKWGVLSLSDAGGAKETGLARDEIVADDFEDTGVESSDILSGPSLLPPAGNLDFNGAKEVFIQLEELASLFRKMSTEEQLARVNADTSFQTLLNAASTGEDVDNENTMLLASFVVTVAGIPFSVLMTSRCAEGELAVKKATNVLKASVKESISTVRKSIEKGIKKEAVENFVSPQIVRIFLGGISDSLQIVDQSKLTADCAVGFKEGMMKMNETLHALYSAQVKAEEAASRV